VIPALRGESPSERVEVVETTRVDGDERERSVTLRWRGDESADD
jgi:hypothetical protein